MQKEISCLDLIKALFAPFWDTCRRNEQVSSPPELPCIPFDIIIEILSWLPVESLVRFKCVCKQWFFLIDQDKKFIAKQRVRGSHSFLHYYQHRHITSIAPLSDENFEFEAETGGLCLETRVGNSHVARIRNPATRQVLYLPEAHKDTRDISFTFDTSTGEGKAVSTYHIKEEHEWFFTYSVGCQVLTIGKDEQWRPLKLPPNQDLPENGDAERASRHVKCVWESSAHVIHVCVHAMVGQEIHLEIYSLDMWSESFTAGTLIEGSLLHLECFIWDDRLAVVEVVPDEDVLDILVLEDYKQNKWSEKVVSAPLKFPKEHEILKDELSVTFVIDNQIYFVYKEQFLLCDMTTKNARFVEPSKAMEQLLASENSSLVKMKGMKPEYE